MTSLVVVKCMWIIGGVYSSTYLINTRAYVRAMKRYRS